MNAEEKDKFFEETYRSILNDLRKNVLNEIVEDHYREYFLEAREEGLNPNDAQKHALVLLSLRLTRAEIKEEFYKRIGWKY